MYDRMGYGYGHFNAASKAQLGWINVQDISTSGIYTISALEPSASGAQVLHFHRGTPPPKEFYPGYTWNDSDGWVEYRNATGLDNYTQWGRSPVPPGLAIHIKPTPESFGLTYNVLPAFTRGDPTSQILKQGQTYKDETGVTITNVSMNGSNAQVQVTFPGSNPPPPSPSSNPNPSPSSNPTDSCTTVDCYQPRLSLTQPAGDVTVSPSNPTLPLTYSLSFGNPQASTNNAVTYLFAQNQANPNDIQSITGCVGLPRSQTNCTWNLSSYAPGQYRIWGVATIPGKSNGTPVALALVTYGGGGNPTPNPGTDTCTTVDCYGPQVTMPQGDMTVTSSPATFPYTLTFSNPLPATSNAFTYFVALNLTTNQVTAMTSCFALPRSQTTCRWDLSGYTPATYRIYAVVAIPGKTNSTVMALSQVQYQNTPTPTLRPTPFPTNKPWYCIYAPWYEPCKTAS